MTRRVPASMRTRESLSDLIEGRLSSADGRAALVKLATRLIVEEALEAESRERRRNNPPLKRPVDPAAADQNGTAYSLLSGLL